MSIAYTFNATNIAPSAAPEAVPTGIYDVIIAKSAEKKTTAGGTMFVFDLKILSGDYTGKAVIDRINVKHENPQVTEIAAAQLSAISHVTGVMAWQNTAQLHNIPFKVSVTKEERDDKPGQYNNNVKGYLTVNGDAPGQESSAPAPAGFGAAPAPAAAPAAAPAPVAAPAPAPAPAPVAAAPAPQVGALPDGTFVRMDLTPMAPCDGAGNLLQPAAPAPAPVPQPVAAPAPAPAPAPVAAAPAPVAAAPVATPAWATGG